MTTPGFEFRSEKIKVPCPGNCLYWEADHYRRGEDHWLFISPAWIAYAHNLINLVETAEVG